jgi:CubicO group peptidase (beta-lactamase class C family)
MHRTTGTRLKLACMLVGLVALAACRSSDPLVALEKPDSIDNVGELRAYGDELLAVAMKQHLRSGFSAAIVSGDGMLWSRSVGTMTGTGAQALPLTTDTPMHIGSVTKLFTALALMQLVEQGKVDLDANLRTYLPEFSIHSRFGNGDFTLRQMLTHYSGLPSDLMEDFAGDPADTRALFDSTVERSALTHLKSRPELAHSYSNLAFQLLGIVIQRVSGESYDAYIRDHIFAPLRMQHSAVLVPDAGGKWPLELTTTDPREVGYEPIGSLPAAAIVSSIDDMALFMQMLLAEGEGIVSKEAFREMQRIQDTNVTVGGGRQGLAFELMLPPLVPLASSGHAGALRGHHAYLRFFPGRNVGIVVLETTDDAANNTSLLAANLRDVALEYVAPGSSQSPPRAEPDGIVAVTQSAAEAARYEGRYFAHDIGLLDVDNDDGELTVRLLSSPLAKAQLTSVGNDTFIPALRVLGFIPLSTRAIGLDAPQLHFVFDGDRRYIALAANGAPPQAIAASLETREVNREWRRRFGMYEPVDGRGGLLYRVTLRMNQRLGLLTVDARTAQGEKLELTLELLSDMQAAVAGVGRYTGEIIEFVTDEEFMFEGARFKRI